MVDIVEKSVRSRMMASIRAKNTQPEMVVRHYIHSQGFRYRVHVRSLPGCPDIVLPKYRLIIFVHGCFWHQHTGCRYATSPHQNHSRWQLKFEQNASRDARNIKLLAEQGWRVFLLWECGARKMKTSNPLDWLPDMIRDKNKSYLEWPDLRTDHQCSSQN